MNRSGKSRGRLVFAAGVYYCLARYLPPSNAVGGRAWRGFRAILIRAFVAGAGSRLDISRMVYVGFGKEFFIGDDSGLGVGVELHGPVTIGNHVMISPEVMIHTRNHRFSDVDTPIGQQGYELPKAVVIEDDVWVGARTIILPGVRIGRGSVVGAGTVLARSVEPYSIVVGNPGRVIGSRLGGR